MNIFERKFWIKPKASEEDKKFLENQQKEQDAILEQEKREASKKRKNTYIPQHPEDTIAQIAYDQATVPKRITDKIPKRHTTQMQEIKAIHQKIKASLDAQQNKLGNNDPLNKRDSKTDIETEERKNLEDLISKS